MEMVTPAATEIGLDEYMAAAMFEPGTIRVIRHVQRITEESDLGPWQPGFEDLAAPGPEYKDGHIDVLDALKALDLRVPVPIPYLLTISEAANEKLIERCLKNGRRFEESRKGKKPVLRDLPTNEESQPSTSKVHEADRIGMIQTVDSASEKPEHEYHVEHIEWVLHALKDAGFKVALEKSEFFLSDISFLGYIVTVDGLKPDPRKVAANQDAPAPVTLTQVRAFLGMASYYRRFIKAFAGIAKPLTNLLKKEEQLIWMSECEAAFPALKEALTFAPVLARPDPTRPFALHTDWQPQAISAVLTQHAADEREHVIENASKTLSRTQANYEACKGECLAVVWRIQHFRPYLYGHKSLQLPYPMRNFPEYLVELTDVEQLPLVDEDAWELHWALYSSVVLGMFTFFVEHDVHNVGELLYVYYVIAKPKPERKEGTVALYPFGRIRTNRPGLLQLIHIDLLSIAQVIAAEEEDLQLRLSTASAPCRSYNTAVILDYLAREGESVVDFGHEDKPLRPPTSYPKPAALKAPRKRIVPKRRRSPSPEAQASQVGRVEEVVQPKPVREVDPVRKRRATLIIGPQLGEDCLAEEPRRSKAIGSRHLSGPASPISIAMQPGHQAQGGDWDELHIPHPYPPSLQDRSDFASPPGIPRSLTLAVPPSQTVHQTDVDHMVELGTIRLEAIEGAPRPDPAWESFLQPPFDGCIAARLVGTLIYKTGGRPNIMYHILVFAAVKRERRPYTETHLVLTGRPRMRTHLGPRSELDPADAFAGVSLLPATRADNPPPPAL
ncbi:hypothetical protein CBR_g45490 [Chara braunii]|uniref:Reverse transcriptase/retrotransposon-derived protein RNase H-like domain-containing protein n=1 Tax=Chara braunii TaxID=69332 RepID=A0A388LYX2_CHABU|nr:hypothetical protein CBR_g45490 [Chara braunii]|eukprot:GBG87432.1 hypothetical protein CBR_g45490 [Chara braunii]